MDNRCRCVSKYRRRLPRLKYFKLNYTIFLYTRKQRIQAGFGILYGLSSYMMSHSYHLPNRSFSSR